MQCAELHETLHNGCISLKELAGTSTQKEAVNARYCSYTVVCLITTVAQHTVDIAFTDDRRHHCPGAVLDEIFFVGGGGGP